MDVDEGLSVAEVDAFSVVEEQDIVVEVEEDEENDSWDFKIIVSSMTKFNVFYCGMIVLLFFLLLDIYYYKYYLPFQCNNLGIQVNVSDIYNCCLIDN